MIQLKLLYVTFLDHGHESKFNVTDVTGGKVFLFLAKSESKISKTSYGILRVEKAQSAKRRPEFEARSK